MSDYLHNLAARHLGRADTLRPRLAPLLGPAPFDSAWEGAEASPREPEISPQESRVERSAASRTVPRFRGDEDDTTADSSAAGAELSARTLVHPAPVPKIAEAAEVETSLNDQPERTPPVAVRPESMGKLAGRPARPFARPAVAPPSGDQSALTSDSRKSGIVPAILPQAGPTAGDANAFSVRASVPSGRGTPDAPRTSRQPERTIHVTIGRIEVRAINPDPPAKPARPPVTTTSLEEYMRRESRGGGR